jgi:hypothetical protein
MQESTESRQQLCEAVAFHLGRRALDTVGRVLQAFRGALPVVVGVYRDADHLRRFLDYPEDEPPEPLVLNARFVPPVVLRNLGALSPAGARFILQYGEEGSRAALAPDQVAVVVQVRDDPGSATVCTYDIDRLLQGHAAVREAAAAVEAELGEMSRRAERRRRAFARAAWLVAAVWAALLAWGVAVFFWGAE